MSGDAQLLLLIAGVHLFGFVCVGILILPALREGWGTPPGGFGSDGDDGGGGPDRPTAPRAPSPSGGLPLPDALPARERLRDHGRLADQVPGRERRPAHAPQREPTRTPA
jgi:hypothetical protein